MTIPTLLRISLPDRDLTVELSPADAGLSLAAILDKAGLPLNTRCAARGLCDGCRVEVLSGTVADADGADLSADTNGLVRACDARPSGSDALHVRIPVRSLLADGPEVLDTFKINIPRAHQPICGAAAGDVGIAIDIGTTTVALLAVALDDGRVLARTAGLNRQATEGDNVLTRIVHAGSEDGRRLLQQRVVEETILPLLQQALRTANVKASQVRCFTAAGNTTMLHLLAGEDPTPMGRVPFTPAFLEHRCLQADEVGLRTAGKAPLHLLPGAAAYLGADICGGALASGLCYAAQPQLLVDIGTNGEIVLGRDGQLVGCATAAGPAFEGSGLSWGMRAGVGAISRLWLDSGTATVRYECVGGKKVAPAGLCGSAYVDVLAEGRRIGALNEAGRWKRTTDAELLDVPGEGRALVIARDADDRPVYVTDADLARVLQAKAAIAAGILTLLERLDVTAADIDKLYLAGGFGLHLNTVNAIETGLLPGFRPEQIDLVGNTSLAAAYLALLDASLLAELRDLAPRIDVVELNEDPMFEMRYVEQMMV